MCFLNTGCHPLIMPFLSASIPIEGLWARRHQSSFNMTDKLPSSCPKKSFPVFSFVLPVFLLCTAFNNNPANTPCYPDDAEVMQIRQYVSGYAQNFVGVPYRRAGTSPRIGFDCSGFTSYIYKEFELKASACSMTQSTEGEKIALEDVLPGDLVFFGRGQRIQHVAMVVERTEAGIFCVHSTCTRGVVVENISTSKYWKPKILFARDVITRQANQLF